MKSILKRFGLLLVVALILGRIIEAIAGFLMPGDKAFEWALVVTAGLALGWYWDRIYYRLFPKEAP